MAELKADGEPTVYVNDNPVGVETEVYHRDRSCASTLANYRNDYTRETTPSEAVAEGLRPCGNCNPPLPDRHLQIDGENADPEDLSWQYVTKKPVDVEATRIEDRFQVVTREGTMEAEDAWLIRGVEGELYPIDPDIFAKTYIPDPTKVPKHTDGDVLDVVRRIHEEREDGFTDWNEGLERAIDFIESDLLEYDIDGVPEKPNDPPTCAMYECTDDAVEALRIQPNESGGLVYDVPLCAEDFEIAQEAWTDD